MILLLRINLLKIYFSPLLFFGLMQAYRGKFWSK